MNRRLVSIVLSLMLVVSMLLVIPSTASAVDSGEMALTDSVEVTVHKGDTVNYWVEVTIPQDSIDVAGWTVDMYYDNAMFDLNTDFADGYGFASGTKAIDYALGLSNEEVSFPGGSITQGTLRPELGRASVSDANPRGLKFRGNTTKVVCLQLQAIANGTTDISYRMRDLADTNLELSFIEKPSYQPAGGAEFALKHSIICDHEEPVDPTEPETEPVTDPSTEAPTEPETDPATDPATEPETDPATDPATEPVTDAPVKHTYTVAGTPGLCGLSWDVTDANNDMTEIDDGVFQKVYTNVNAGAIEFKVAEDYSWNNSFGPEGNEPGSPNCVDEVLFDGATVTITFDTKEGVVMWMIDYPEDPTEEPTDAPTELPTEVTTEVPTSEPIVAPTEAPTSEPTVAPTEVPTSEPTVIPTEVPTSEPTVAPTEAPTSEPTVAPTSVATDKPTTPTNATNATTATNATSATTGSTSSSNTTNTTTTTGKVATGDASSVAMLLGMLMIAAGTVISARRKFTSK